MRAFISTEAALAQRLRQLLEARGWTIAERVDADLVLSDDTHRAIAWASDSSVVFVGSADASSLLAAGVLNIVPAGAGLEFALDVTLARAELSARAQLSPGTESSVPSVDALLEVLGKGPDALTITTHEVIVFANESAGRILMDEPCDLVGRHGSSFVHPDSRSLIQEDQRYLVEGKPSPLRELRFLRSDGSSVVTETVAFPIDFGGKRSVLRLTRDRQTIRTLEERLVLADRLASVGTMAAGIAHELNNPLAYVLTNLQLCKEELREVRVPLSVRDYLDTSIDGSHRIAAIVRDLRTFSRGPSGVSEAVEIQDSLKAALQICENEIRHRGTLTQEIGPTPVVEINASRLCQVFVNLLINAAHAIEDETAGTIHLSTGTDERGWARFSVRDNGPGIAPDDMPRIFEPFFTTKASPDGTGLGLLICRNIITQADGEMHVESRPGEGATFTVYLPPCDRAPTERQKSSAPPVAARSASILVIDDERLIGRAIERALREHQVVVVDNGKDALDLLRGRSFDVVFCDLMMPGLSGMDVFDEVARQDPALSERFVFMTGGAFTAGAREFLEATKCEVIDKPFSIKSLREITARRIGDPAN